MRDPSGNVERRAMANRIVRIPRKVAANLRITSLQRLPGRRIRRDLLEAPSSQISCSPFSLTWGSTATERGLRPRATPFELVALAPVSY
jgi:hypothetical protein